MTLLAPSGQALDARPGIAGVLKPVLRTSLRLEWQAHGYFPCWAQVDPRGDPTFTVADLYRYMLSRTSPALRLAALALWPARLVGRARLFRRRSHPAHTALPLDTASRLSIRFHTFFTDAYLSGAVERIAAEPGLEESERAFWEGVLAEIAAVALQNRQAMALNDETFDVWPFFPPSSLEQNPKSPGSRFLRLSGLAGIDNDADDTFVLLEMLARRLESASAGADEAQTLACLLERPYWKLARFYQFYPQGTPAPLVNYTGIQPEGGVSTWFSQRPIDAPDLAVNANVLRSLLVNAQRWGVLDNPEAVDLLQRMAEFLYTNTASGRASGRASSPASALFRTRRGYSFYIPEFFYAMFARLWAVFERMPVAEQRTLDPQARLQSVRQAVSQALLEDLHPSRPGMGPLDAALAISSALRLGVDDSQVFDGWLKILEKHFRPSLQPYPAYEVFKGKIPTHMIYGSPAITAAFVYEALDLLEKAGYE